MISLSIADGVAEVVLNAPQKLNSLDEQALADLVPGVRRRRCRRLAR
jgi:enoyl-CoA hydratase/carnithine racemase